MMNTTKKLAFGERINKWLDEPPGETFKLGKWRFWLVMLLGFSLLNAVMTAVVFGSGGQLQTYLGGILLAVGVLLAWLCIGTLHYSDSADVRMAKGVSLLDSITLVFVIAHFCFLLYVQGHAWMLQAREADYKASAIAYNEKAERIQADNVRIAEETRKTAQEVTKAERLRNDTAYQERRAAEAGGTRRPRAGGKSVAGSLSTSPIELEKPEKPKESSTDFLTRWDLWVRLMNFGELALAAVTFIYIRNRSAKFNASHPRTRRDDEEFPDELDADVSVRGGAKEPRLTAATTQAKRASERSDATPVTPQNVATQVSLNSDDTGSRKRTTLATTQSDTGDGLKRLRECLKLISFHNPGVHFKADVKDDCVWIRTMESKHGEQRTVASTKAALSILDDALKMEPNAFRARLEQFLMKRGFPLNSATG